MYNSEEEFLAHYNIKKYKQLSLTTDIIIFSVSDIDKDDYKKVNKKNMSILLVKRTDYPFKDKWCLPGGFLDFNEDLEECPKRILKKETNLENIYLEQLYTFGKVNRDPRTRVVSTAYLSLIDRNRLNQKLNPNAKWFDIKFVKNELILESDEDKISIKFKKVLDDITNESYSYVINKNESVAFDHAEVILKGIERLKNKVLYTDIVFNMMPKEFTLGELQRVYEAILEKEFIMTAFRRMVDGKVEKTDKIQIDGGHRPSVLYKYIRK